MEAERIQVVKDWPELKSVRNIQVFLGFANFYQQFIQGFSKIATPLTSMLKTTGSPNKPAPSKNDGSKSASNRNNDSKPASGKNDGNGKINRFGISRNGMEHAKKSGKLFKLENLSKSGQSKSEKLSKSQKLSKTRKLSKSQKSAKSEKKLSKNGNLFNFDAKENGPSFLTPNTRTAFNYLWLAFTKALIF